VSFGRGPLENLRLADHAQLAQKSLQRRRSKSQPLKLHRVTIDILDDRFRRADYHFGERTKPAGFTSEGLNNAPGVIRLGVDRNNHRTSPGGVSRLTPWRRVCPARSRGFSVPVAASSRLYIIVQQSSSSTRLSKSRTIQSSKSRKAPGAKPTEPNQHSLQTPPHGGQGRTKSFF